MARNPKQHSRAKLAWVGRSNLCLNGLFFFFSFFLRVGPVLEQLCTHLLTHFHAYRILINHLAEKSEIVIVCINDKCQIIQ